MSGKTQGDYYERETAAALLADGYWVIKAGGSLGPADLVALKRGEILLVQVKKGRAVGKGATNTLTHAEWNALHELAAITGGLALVAGWPTRRELGARPGPGQKWGDRLMECHRIRARHLERSKHWPADPFTLDRVEAEAAS